MVTSCTTLPINSDQGFDFRPWARCPGQENTGEGKIILGQWTRGQTGNRVPFPEDTDGAESKNRKWEGWLCWQMLRAAEDAGGRGQKGKTRAGHSRSGAQAEGAEPSIIYSLRSVSGFN